MSVTYHKLSVRVQKALQKDKNLKDLTQPQIAALLRYAFLYIGEALANGEDVYLEGFGRFRPDCKPPRKIKSWITDKEHTTDYKVYVKFTAFKQLNTQVQQFLAKIGFVPTETEEEMLPHQKDDTDDQEEFVSMEQEIAKRFNKVHPDADMEFQDDPALPRKVSVPKETNAEE